MCPPKEIKIDRLPMQTVCVLMSTYSGAMYLNEQLDSIRRQIEVNVELIVRDDGSDDNGATIKLLENYKAKYPKFKLSILRGENIGWKRSFKSLLHDAPKCEYYAFADQDDIWLPNKLCSAIGMLNKHLDGAALYYSNLYYYEDDINKGIIHRDCKGYQDKYKAFMRNLATGCTIVFNYKMKQLVDVSKGSDYDIAHDHLLFMLAAFWGNLVFDENPKILYRQHSSNLIGNRSDFIKNWSRRLKSMFSNSKDHRREERAKFLLENYHDRLTADEKSELESIIRYRSSIRDRMHLIFSRKLILDSPLSTIRNKFRLINGNF